MLGRVPVGKLSGWTVRFVFLIPSATFLAGFMGAVQKHTDVAGVPRYDSRMMATVGISERF